MDLFGRKRIAELEIANANLNRRLQDQEDMRREADSCWRDLAKQLSANNIALGRVIAKVDPTFAQDELDPKRKAASDVLGQEVIRKIMNDDHFSNRTRGY